MLRRQPHRRRRGQSRRSSTRSIASARVSRHASRPDGRRVAWVEDLSAAEGQRESMSAISSPARPRHPRLRRHPQRGTVCGTGRRHRLVRRTTARWRSCRMRHPPETSPSCASSDVERDHAADQDDAWPLPHQGDGVNSPQPRWSADGRQLAVLFVADRRRAPGELVAYQTR